MGHPAGRGITVTVRAVLYGGPHDGAGRDVARRAAEPMPAELPGMPGYHLVGQLSGGTPRWQYRWRAEHTGRRRPCSQPDCKGAGCPRRRRPGATPTTT